MSTAKQTGNQTGSQTGKQKSAPGHALELDAARNAIGSTTWAIPEGFIPGLSHGPSPTMVSHEAACILNTGDRDAHVEITVFFADREPVGPYLVTVPARRTKHLRFNDLRDPELIPRDTDYSSVIISDVPVIVQHTRLDSRQAANALLSTIAYAAASSQH